LLFFDRRRADNGSAIAFPFFDEFLLFKLDFERLFPPLIFGGIPLLLAALTRFCPIYKNNIFINKNQKFHINN